MALLDELADSGGMLSLGRVIWCHLELVGTAEGFGGGVRRSCPCESMRFTFGTALGLIVWHLNHELSLQGFMNFSKKYF